MLPTQNQLLLPLLEEIQKRGGSAVAGDVIEAVSDRLSIPEGVRNDYREVDCGKWGMRRRSPWRQRLHWVRQNAVCAGLIDRSTTGVWTLSEKGRGSLVNCEPGLILTVYETPNGEAIWCDAMTAAGAYADNSIDLLFTSPPYPLAGKGRAYGNYTPGDTIQLVVNCAREWHRALKDDASVILNFRDTWIPKRLSGGAVRSLYQEKLLIALCEDVGLYFADRLYWNNPSHMPDTPWVTIQRVRLNPSVENVFWLSKSPNPKADNQKVLVPAKDSTLQTYLAKARRQQRSVIGPSGHNNVFEEQVAAAVAGKSIKVIPRNLLDFANSDPRTSLHRELKKLGLPKHDAVMPYRLAEFFIRFLTEENDLVVDPFHGSGVTGWAAENLGRRWLGSDRSLAHVLGSAVRFPVDTLHYGLAG